MRLPPPPRSLESDYQLLHVHPSPHSTIDEVDDDDDDDDHDDDHDDDNEEDGEAGWPAAQQRAPPE